jgi:hypothetical protein
MGAPRILACTGCEGRASWEASRQAAIQVSGRTRRSRVTGSVLADFSGLLHCSTVPIFPQQAKGGREPAASPPASAGSVHLDSQLTLRSQHARYPLGLRQQQGLGEPRRIASEFSSDAQDIPGTQQEARNGTHEEPGCHLLTRERHTPGVPG